MKIVLVSSYPAELDELEQTVNKTFPDWSVARFTDPFYSDRYITQNPVDLALVAARLHPPTGAELTRVLRRTKPELSVVLFADTEEYKSAARDAGAYDYLILPLTAEKLKDIQQAVEQQDDF